MCVCVYIVTLSKQFVVFTFSVNIIHVHVHCILLLPCSLQMHPLSSLSSLSRVVGPVSLMILGTVRRLSVHIVSV